MTRASTISKSSDKPKRPRAARKEPTRPQVARKVPPPIVKLLWARAAGRCECAGCNVPLWKSEVSQEAMPTGQNAHIWSFSEGGPRGQSGIKAKDVHHPSNLILVCYPCHCRIDNDKLVEKYSVEVLKSWKNEHETRVERVTGISSTRKSHVIFYGANIGAQTAQWDFREVAEVVFPGRYPAEDNPIELSLLNSAARDDGSRFWELELENLRANFDRLIRSRIGRGIDPVRHTSVFALAPQPLLIAVGAFLGEIVAGDVYQLRREPPQWGFVPETDAGGWPELSVEVPDDTSGVPALVISLSASVTSDRIEAVLGKDTSIWRLTVPQPHNDVVTRRSQLRSFRRQVRLLLDELKSLHGQGTMLHVFPVMPASTAVELGRVRMPKAEMPWRIYDQLPRQGFVPALEIVGDEISAVMT